MSAAKMVEERSAQQQAKEWLQRLKAEGYRLTAARRAVVETLAGESKALTPAEIYELGRQRHARLGLVTVYRTLEKLEELGLVQSVHLRDGSHGYLAEFRGHQHLLFCMNCGRVQYFEGDDLSAIVETLEGESGYQIAEHWLQFSGLCADCQ